MDFLLSPLKAACICVACVPFCAHFFLPLNCNILNNREWQKNGAQATTVITCTCKTSAVCYLSTGKLGGMKNCVSMSPTNINMDAVPNYSDVAV